MGGITQFVGEDSAAVLAVLSGNDFLCCSSYKVQIPAVIKAVEDGRISEARIDESVLKLIELKLRLGIIE
jgi:beta-N-acetylhexosaminidase